MNPDDAMKSGMKGRHVAADLCAFELTRTAGTPLFRQLYLQLRSAILSQRLRPGTKLPSTRDLAGQLGVSRSAAVAAYEQLLAEGYTSGRHGSGASSSGQGGCRRSGRHRAGRYQAGMTIAPE